MVLYFWAALCRPCVVGTPQLKNIYTDLETSFGDDFEMISLGMDDSEHVVREHIKKYGLNGADATTEPGHSIASVYFGRPLTESTAVYIMMSNGQVDLDRFEIKPLPG